MSEEIRNRYSPDYVSIPGETLLDTINAIGMTQVELAQRMGRPKKKINEIIAGKTAITPETALQLERVLGIPASFWNNRDSHYRESLAKEAEISHLTDQVKFSKKMPVQAMIKLGWIQYKQDKIEQLKEILNFFSVASIKQWKNQWLTAEIAFRRSKAFKSAPEAIAAWLRYGQIIAQRLERNEYNSVRFGNVLDEIRKLTTQPPEVFQKELIKICAECGVAIAFVPELPQTRISGATYWLFKKPVIQLTLRYKTNDHLWFTFFHEAGHIILHGRRDVFIEEERVSDQKEKEADKFASDKLIPESKYKIFISSRTFSKSAIRN